MQELKEYLTPNLLIIEVGDYVFTTNSREDNNTSDPYDPNGGNQWWE